MAAPAQIGRVVVTGGAGFIGVHSVEALLDGGAEVLVIDDLRHASYRPLPSSARLEVADVAESPARAAIEAFKPSAILHLAAQGGVNRSWREPAEDAHINVLGTVSVLAAAVAAGCRRVVVASSGGALYGAARRLPTPEDEPTQPRSPYGTAKLCIEHYLGYFTAPARSTPWRCATATCTDRGRTAPARRGWSRSPATGCSQASRR